jgi:hypothetical protein
MDTCIGKGFPVPSYMRHYTVGIMMIDQNVLPFILLLKGDYHIVEPNPCVRRGLTVLILNASHEQFSRILLKATSSCDFELREILNQVFLTLSDKYPEIKKTKLPDGTFKCHK